MTPIEAEVIRRKLGIITENLRALQPVKSLSLEEYRRDLFRRKGTERLLQELIEAAVDINTHLTTAQGQGPPDDYYDSFLKMGDLGVLSSELANGLAPSAGLRNRLVHEYDLLDDELILASVRTAQDLYARYVKAVEDFLKTNP
ncbi:MAG: DUF86 domain-containing protein [Candidatus Tectomicrobia bacterium]|uniref:DUF86 domain-containing protein n=1 Tax=Tectimicrobiota bacterium TaxID=2528274 RepID=A0A932GPJ7_UNCTE|nr:DUF86 domain-containing protein [Candidatus Tectomicrobia bacterium]